MDKIKLSASMLIFGTIGLFVKYIPLSSGIIAMTRGYSGALFLLLIMLISRKKLDFTAIKKNLIPLLISGTAIGINWILLFESFNYTSVAIATLCYYMQPVLLVLLTPIVLKTKPSRKKILCIFPALIGMVLISGVFSSDTYANPVGIILGLSAALFYTTVILTNKFLKNISSFESTILQLLIAAFIITPYNLIQGFGDFLQIESTALLLLAIVGFLHTGFTYFLYFASIKTLPSETVAIYSYIDPAFAIILSVFVLKEPLSISGIIGAILILGACILSETNKQKLTFKRHP